jgi:thiamine biosynthesis lipoprotein
MGHLRLSGCSQEAASSAVFESVTWLRQAEAKFSRFIETSLVSRLNRGEVVVADHELIQLIAAANRAHQLTGGRIDVTMLPVWMLWHDKQRTRVPSAGEITEARSRCGIGRIEVEDQFVRLSGSGMQIDFGGVGKEWCIDQMATKLHLQGIHHFLIELAGDVVAHGRQSTHFDGWWVMLPHSTGAYLLKDSALATSGHRQRFRVLDGRKISHLIDAQTGSPASGHVAAATVTADDCVDAGIAASDIALAADTEAAMSRKLGLPGMITFGNNTMSMDHAFLQHCCEVEVRQPHTLHPAIDSYHWSPVELVQ